MSGNCDFSTLQLGEEELSTGEITPWLQPSICNFPCEVLLYRG